MNDGKKVLLGLTVAELKEVCRSLGMPAFTGGQIAQWLYGKHVMTIDEMTNLSKQNREKLAAQYSVGAMPPIDCQRSVDGTIKYLFPVRCADACDPNKTPSSASCDSVATPQTRFVETVFIPDGERASRARWAAR